MSHGTRLEKLEASITGPGDGSDDLCPKCGGLQLETLMREAEGVEADPTSQGTARSEVTTLSAARCRRCGAPTLLALLAVEVEKWEERQA